MIKVLTSELLKSCLIENHIPESALAAEKQPEKIVDFDPVEREDLPGEFTAPAAEKTVSPETWRQFRQTAEAFFAPDGPLKAAAEHGGRPFEYRVQQQEMAAATADALSNLRNLAIEAPTGVGKSFAYLVPAILYSKLTGKPTVITTETISLQEQLMEKDLPLLKKLLNVQKERTLTILPQH